ncbi:MAG: hypothetical protein IKA50_00815 [Clostridia bacterium]|nr:hypothetical protein [Clostridia bacterium]
MKKGKMILTVLMYILLVMVLFFQVLGLVAVIWGPEIFGAALPKKLQEAHGLIPSWIIAVVLTVAAVVLCKVWKKKEKKSLIPMACGIIGAALALIVALTLRAALELQVSNSNVSQNYLQGLNGWKLFWRHYSLVGVAFISAIVSFVHFRRLRGERIRVENEGYTETFALDGDAIFSDEKDTPSPKKNTKKLSKKQRKERREKENGGI